MIYNNLIFFLGFYSWNYKSTNFFDTLICSKFINNIPLPPRNNRILIKYLETQSNSPNFNLYRPEIKLDKIKKYKIYLYELYSFLIFIFLSIEPIYLLYKSIHNYTHFIEFFVSFLCHINTPIVYLWAKYYFKNNHFKKYHCNNKKKCNILLFFLIFSSLLSICLNLIIYDSFINEHNAYNLYNIYLTYILSILDWIYSRLCYSLTVFSFTVVFCDHISKLKNLKTDIFKNEKEIKNEFCLTKIISSLSNLRNSIEISIDFFNNILSFITITSTLSLTLFIKFNTEKFKNFNFEQNDLYLNQYYILFIIFQFIFFINIYIYTNIREHLYKILQSPAIINTFLTRWCRSKIENNTNFSKKFSQKKEEEILQNTKIILCIDEENATTLDWIVVEKIINTRWLNFTIMGINITDGDLIKKIIALSGFIYLLIDFY